MIDYRDASYQQLATWLKAYLEYKGVTCEREHRNCGCTPEPNPPCVLAVIGEIESRRANTKELVA